jgi:hypothetical protein
MFSHLGFSKQIGLIFQGNLSKFSEYLARPAPLSILMHMWLNKFGVLDITCQGKLLKDSKYLTGCRMQMYDLCLIGVIIAQVFQDN